MTIKEIDIFSNKLLLLGFKETCNNKLECFSSYELVEELKWVDITVENLHEEYFIYVTVSYPHFYKECFYNDKHALEYILKYINKLKKDGC